MQTEPRPARSMFPRKYVDTRRISVVIPVFNGAAHLAATLQSVADQSCAPGEVIVVDDGSTDDSAKIAESFDVTVIRQVNRGLSAARNVGTRAASGEYIAYLDSDDLWAREKLKIQFGALCALGKPAFSFTDFRLFNEAGVDERYGILTHPAFKNVAGRSRHGKIVVITANDRRPVLPDDYILPSSTIVRRADFMTLGGFDETLHICEDHDFFLRLFSLVPAVGVVQPLVLYRRHATQISAKPVALIAAWFEVKQRVEAAPERYPRGDVRYFAKSAWMRHRRIAILHFRLANFEEAGAAFNQSLQLRFSMGALAGIGLARSARSGAGQLVFVAIRAIVRRWRSQLYNY